MYSSEVPRVGEHVHVEELGKDYRAERASYAANDGCSGCAGHGNATICQALPDCSTRSTSIVFKEITWPQKPYQQ